jgi:subfamily B ATP-binding cassette protein MsbA
MLTSLLLICLKVMKPMLGDRGVNISGGQRQRIAIARAILKESPHPDSGRSYFSTGYGKRASWFRKHWTGLMVGRTAIVIAHRLSTVKNADRILVLDEGKLVEDGNHEQLMAMDGLYAHLYKIQYRNKVAQ